MQQARLSKQNKDIECNLRLNISTERQETMSSYEEFQLLIIRFERKFASASDTIADLYSLAQCLNVTTLHLGYRTLKRPPKSRKTETHVSFFFLLIREKLRSWWSSELVMSLTCCL